MVTLARFGLTSFVAAGTLVAGTAYADSVPSPTAKCETTLQCSSGQAALKQTSRTRLATTVDSGWIPACPLKNGKAQDHCSDQPVQVRADLAFDAPTDDTTDSLYSIELPRGAIVQASWKTTQFIDLNLANGGHADGVFKVAHTLVPNVSLYVSLFGLHQQFDFDSTTLVNDLPGANFNYNARASANFTPWAFDGANVTVPGPALSQTELLSVQLADLGVGDVVSGTLALSATTSPTFTYKTTKVTLSGADAVITTAAGTAKLPMKNQDYIDVVADVEGVLSFAGDMELVPSVALTKAFGNNVSLNIPINVGAKTSYDNADTPLTVSFPKQTVHIPLPNVFVPADAVDFGVVKTGTMVEKTISINNTGELGAMLSYESSDPQFSFATGSATTAPKSKVDLVVRYVAGSIAAATGVITVKSNDPDAPVQTFKVFGASNPKAPAGSDPNNNGDEPKPATGSDSSGGCGCRVSSPTSSDVGGFGVLGLAVLGFVRRRRNV